MQINWTTELQSNNICIFGSKLRGLDCKRILEDRFSLKVYCFLDNDKQKHGQKFDNIIIHSPQKLLKMKDRVIVFVATQNCFQEEIIPQLKSMGITKIIKYNCPSDLSFLKEFLPYKERIDKLPLKTMRDALNSKSAKLIALYLPQFHTIPENDRWWGKGFTEWTNIKSMLDKPHIQPLSIPGELGYYDLSDVSVMRKQTELAKQYGIYGFCFYHYYLGNGKRLLEKPFENYLQSDINFPYCLCWANHDWSRRWRWGADIDTNCEMLLKQTYENPKEHFDLLLRAFRDKRYIKINGKPLFIVWQAELVPNVLQVVKLWRKLALEAGLPGLYLLKVERPFASEWHEAPKKLGFDASMEFLPSGYKNFTMVDNFFKEHKVFEYNEYFKHTLYKKSRYKKYPSIFTKWDNTPRYKGQSLLYLNSSPEKYRQWLSYCIERVQKFKQDERLVFLNAWNEWGEGAVLEPDIISGRAYLEATLAALHPKIRKLDLEILKLLGLI
jgi:lipopolysaccharide biosynthesis protein